MSPLETYTTYHYSSVKELAESGSFLTFDETSNCSFAHLLKELNDWGIGTKHQKEKSLEEDTLELDIDSYYRNRDQNRLTESWANFQTGDRENFAELSYHIAQQGQKYPLGLREWGHLYQLGQNPYF
jgi:hypothetical protein